MKKNLLKYIWQYSARQQSVIVFLTCLSFPILYLTLEIPKTIINEALTSDTEIKNLFGYELTVVNYLIVLCMSLLSLIIINGIFKMRINTLKGVIGERLVRRLRYQLIDRLLRFPLPHFSRTSQGELISTLTAEAEPIAGYISESIALPLFQGGTMITILYFMFMQDWVFGLASVALIPVQGYIIPKLQAQVNALKKERIQQVRKLSERIGETVSGAQEIRLQGTQRYTLSEFSYWLSNLFEVRLEIFKKKFFMKFLNNTIGQITPFLFYLFGGMLVIKGDITIGALVAALAAYKDLTSPWRELLNHYQVHEDAKIKYQQIIEQFSPQGLIEQKEQEPVEISDTLDGAVSIKNVSWLSEAGDRLLCNINADFKAGSRIAITSQNAMQRLRLAQLLTALEKPSSGNIEIGGREMSDIPESLLRGRIGYQGPDPHLFSGTISHNVLYGINRRPPLPSEDDPLYAHKTKESIASGNSTDFFHGNWADFNHVDVHDEQELRSWYLQSAAAIGADGIMYQRGLLEYVDPAEYPELSEKLLAARPVIRQKLIEENLTRVVAGFDPDTYNRNATVAENILFGIPATDSLRMQNLAALPNLHEILHRLEIFDLVVGIGAKSAIKLSQRIMGMSQGNSLLAQFNIESEEEIHQLSETARQYKEGELSLNEDEGTQFISLFLHIIPELHAFGFIHDLLVSKLLLVRHEFFLNLPDDLKDQIIRFDRFAYHPKLTIMDNLLFGRVVAKEPAAEKRIDEIVRETLIELDLKADVMLHLTESQVGISGARLPIIARHRIPIGRMVIKKPSVIIFHDALSPFDIADKRAVRRNIKELLPESTLIWIDRDIDNVLDFDEIYTISEDGELFKANQVAKKKPEEMKTLSSLIGQSGIFGALDAHYQQLIAEHSRIVTATEGEFIYKTGDPGRNAYIILKGEAHSLRNFEDPESVAGRLSVGESFGIIEVVVQRPRVLSVQAHSDMKMLRIDGEIIREIIDSDTTVIQTLLRAITEQWSSISR